MKAVKKHRAYDSAHSERKNGFVPMLQTFLMKLLEIMRQQ